MDLARCPNSKGMEIVRMIEFHMKFNSSFGCAELGPVKQREVQVNYCGIDAVKRIFK